MDAHVGKHLFEKCIIDALHNKTRILVTHQLHFLPMVDYILVLKEGRITEQGSFENLIAANGEFSKLMDSYGIKEEEQEERNEELIQGSKDDAIVRIHQLLTEKSENARTLIQKEDRSTGTVKFHVWKTYFDATGGTLFVLFAAFVLLLLQGIRIGNDYWLVVIWTSK